MSKRDFDLLAKAVAASALRERAEREAFSLPAAPAGEAGEQAACLTFARSRALSREPSVTEAERRHLDECGVCAARVRRFRILAEDSGWADSLREMVATLAAAVQAPGESLGAWVRAAKANARLLAPQPLRAAPAPRGDDETPRIEPFRWGDLEITIERRHDLSRLFVTVSTRSPERAGSSVDIILFGATGGRLPVSIRLEKEHPDDEFILGAAALDQPYEETVVLLGPVIIPVPAEGASLSGR